jgi:hypothetical protein
MRPDVEFVAVYGIDIVNSSDPKISSKVESWKEFVWKSLESNEHYQNAIQIGRNTEQSSNDGTFIVTKIKSLPDLLNLARHMWTVIDGFNKTHGFPKLKVRQGIHTGECNVAYDNGKISDASGNGINYCERVMRLGDGSHILITENAHATLSAITLDYEKYLEDIGIYLIKNGKRLRVSNFYDKNSMDGKERSFGNDNRPDKKKKSLISEISRKNQVLGIALMTFTAASMMFGGITFADFYQDVTISESEKTEIRIQIEQKMKNLIDIQQKATLEIQKEFTDTIQNENEEIKITSTQRNNINPFLKAMSFHPEIEYMLVSNPIPNCSVLLYEPYWHSYDPNRDLSQLDRCTGIETYTVYLSSTYFATGPGMFVNSLVTGIYNNIPEYRPPVAHFVMGINWTELIRETIPFTPMDNTRMMLVDHEGFVVFDCTNNSCDKFEENHKSKKPILFNLSLIENRFDYAVVHFEGIDLPQENEHIMKDWVLYVMYPKVDVLSLGILQLSVLILPVVMLGILLYYYLIPRNWLDET